MVTPIKEPWQNFRCLPPTQPWSRRCYLTHSLAIKLHGVLNGGVDRCLTSWMALLALQPIPFGLWMTSGWRSGSGGWLACLTFWSLQQLHRDIGPLPTHDIPSQCHIIIWGFLKWGYSQSSSIGYIGFPLTKTIHFWVPPWPWKPSYQAHPNFPNF